MLRAIPALLVAILATGCPVQERCEPGARMRDGVCRLVSDSGADGGLDLRDAGTDGGDIDDGGGGDAGPSCDGGTICTGSCVDTMSDPMHCGACGETCAARVPCVDGACADGVVQLALGAGSSCARRAGGRVLCWGDNAHGQLGDGTTTVSAAPRPVSDLTDAIDISCGSRHCCAVRATGGISCWGHNERGQLADGTLESPRTSPVPAGGITGAIDVAAGFEHTCAVLGTGDVRCWGRGDEGQIGDEMMEVGRSVFSPTAVAISDATAIAAGDHFNCVVHEAGHMSCWGIDAGAFGDGLAVGQPYPRPVGRAGADQLAAGSDHTCTLTDGSIACSGAGNRGQLGDAMTMSTVMPVDVGGITDAVVIAAGGFVSCAVMASGDAACWGDNYYGQIGDGSEVTNRSSPSMVVGLVDAVSIATGGQHSCGVRRNGGVKCWGPNFYGELGNGTVEPSRTPVDVLSLP